MLVKGEAHIWVCCVGIASMHFTMHFTGVILTVRYYRSLTISPWIVCIAYPMLSSTPYIMLPSAVASRALPEAIMRSWYVSLR